MSTENGIAVSENSVEVSPVSYLGISAFIIGLLVEKGHLKVRRDQQGVHFIKSDMDKYLAKVRSRSAQLAIERAAGS